MNYVIYIALGAIAIFFIVTQARQVLVLNKVRYLIDTYEHDVENPKLIDEMWEYCNKDSRLGKIIRKHNGTKEDFNKFFHKLLTWGNFRKINRFVPINAFFNVNTLEYMFTHPDEDDHKFTMYMMNWFHI